MNKNQIEAIVDEVQERLETLTTPSVMPPKAEAEWKILNEKFAKLQELEKEEQELDVKLDAVRDELRDLNSDTKDAVKTFERKHGVTVEWEYVDYGENEKPEVKFPAKDFRDKIRRQISILSIDKKGPMTADEIIDALVNKLNKA